MSDFKAEAFGLSQTRKVILDIHTEESWGFSIDLSPEESKALRQALKAAEKRAAGNG